MPKDSIYDALFEFLKRQPDGDLTKQIVKEIERQLASCWCEFSGSDSEGMGASKLRSRTEQMRWVSPILTFLIERHGGTALGSILADMHRWDLDFQKKTANCELAGKRQVKQSQPDLDTEQIADEVVQAIVAGDNKFFLKWILPNRVRVLVGKLIPAEGPKQTVAERRARLNGDLQAKLKVVGWARPNGTVAHTYEKSN